MSNHLAAFGCPPVDDDVLFARVREATPALLELSGGRRLALAAGPLAEMPLRWFQLFGDREADRGAVTEVLARFFPVLVSVVHDDRIGHMLYERRGPDRLVLATADGASYLVEGTLPSPPPAFVDAVALGLALDFAAEPRAAVVTRSSGVPYLVADDARLLPAPQRVEIDALPALVPAELSDDEICDGEVIEATPVAPSREHYDLLDQAEAALEAGEVDAARASFRRATEVASTDDLVWLCLARFEAAHGSADDARVAFRRCVALNPGEVLALERGAPALAFLADEPEFRDLLATVLASL